MDSPGLTPRSDLGAGERTAVTALVAMATRVDGVPPLSEQFLLDLHDGSGVRHLLAYAGSDLAGYAQLSYEAAELVVRPDHRRQGVGTTLLAGLPQDVRVWAHGDLPAAPAFALARGLRPVRELYVLERAVTPTEFANRTGLPPGLEVRAFEPGRDEDEWVRVNAAAFSHHPEQGRLTRTDLARRTAEPWFDPAGLLLVVPSRDPDTIAAFHWTKVHPPGSKATGPVGEVYVVGVDPAYQGQGLGRPLTLLGLHHLAHQGLQRVILYVDGDNAPALRVYRSLGFSTRGIDRMYARTSSLEVQR